MNNRTEIFGAVWLVTPMLLDAEAGRFGAPISLPIELLNTGAFAVMPVERDKVERFKTNLSVLTKARPRTLEQRRQYRRSL